MNDGTAGHSKGNWYFRKGCIRQDEYLNGNPIGINIAEMNTALEEHISNSRLLILAQRAPHDCGDPECPGVINKRKLKLYDEFQTAINSLRAQNTELLAALKVFAKAFDGDLENVVGGTLVCLQFKARDFKNAKAVIARARGEKS